MSIISWRWAENPPVNNPMAYWHCGEAIKFAASKQGEYGAAFEKAPWIKCGDDIIPPKKISEEARNIPDDWRGGGAPNG
jgi:hypothetical protein